MPGPGLVVSDRAAAEDVALLEDRINEYNFATTGFRDGRLLAIWLRDGGGRLQAGLYGHTWGGACEVKFLWVEEGLRRAGLGSRLLRAAEDEARARGCARIFLTTHSFQAPGFYRRHGYAVAGELRGYPRGHSQLFLEKALAPER